ncbi:MAG: hypothetical protein DYG89_17190 [Caldilinea sp. CFX5]|nr:hypothetical protein [Caldilinea sp. CFX5]
MLFFAFGYYAAWQSPAVRAFYGETDPGSFLLQMRTIIAGAFFLWRPVSGQASGAFGQPQVTPAAPPARAR